ncbi:hypothetical protein HAX54_047633, partial [Datura stramonium]|nr:hypothetical protein [Datura stramonium]
SIFSFSHSSKLLEVPPTRLGEQGSWGEHCNAVNGWDLEHSVDSIGSILESFLTRILKNQEEEEATLRYMIEVVSAQAESLQSLDFHIIQVLNYYNTPIVYFYEAPENHEVDPSTSCLAHYMKV